MSTQTPKQILFGQFAALAKCLSHPHRLELLEQLAQGERSVEILAGKLGLSTANASQHLQQMRRAGMVASVRKGKFVVYGLADHAVLVGYGHVGSVVGGALIEARVPMLVSKLGDKGTRVWTGEEPVFLAPYSVPVVSTIGAGDGFASGFLFGLVRGMPVIECLHYGNAAAALQWLTKRAVRRRRPDRSVRFLLAAHDGGRSRSAASRCARR